MLLQKCHLLHAQGKLDDFLETAKELLFHEWREIEAENSQFLFCDTVNLVIFVIFFTIFRESFALQILVKSTKCFIIKNS